MLTRKIVTGAKGPRGFDLVVVPSIVLVLLPIVTFHVALWRYSRNLPELDDYDAVLEFLIGWTRVSGVAASLKYFAAIQHVQYKLFFQQIILVVEYEATGSINFRFLQQLGNCFISASALVLWCMFQRRLTRPLWSSLLTFAPAMYILFSLQYSEVINWAMSGLQNVAILPFSMACFYLIGRRSKRSFVGGVSCLVLAIATSGNGFFAAFSGFLFLLQQRAGRRAITWAVVTLLMGLVYSYHYHAVTMPATVTEHLVMLYMLFPLAFLGAAAGGVSIKAGLLVGLLLIVVACCLTLRGWRTKDPSTFYTMVFILITTLGVTVTRHMFGLGPAGAMASRYRLYSELFAALLYLAAINLGVGESLSRRGKEIALVSCLIPSMLFCYSSDRTHFSILKERMGRVRQHYRQWTESPETVSLVPDEELYTQTPEMVAFRKRAAVWTTEAIALGIYKPPPPAELMWPQ